MSLPRGAPPATSEVEVDVLVVGGGPAGLAAAVALRQGGAGRVLVVDREEQVGGVPRHTDHLGFGMRDLRRVLTGPGYARAWTQRAVAAGAELWAPATATGFAGPGAVDLTAPEGRHTVRARALLLATGCRERPRAARLVPGTRPAGVLTTGTLQQLVHLHGERVAGRALVVGAEHVSFSAAHTLARAGAEVAALVTDEPRHQSFALLRALLGLGHRLPVLTSTKVAAVRGRTRVEAVELTDLRSGAGLRPAAALGGAQPPGRPAALAPARPPAAPGRRVPQRPPGGAPGRAPAVGQPSPSGAQPLAPPPRQLVAAGRPVRWAADPGARGAGGARTARIAIASRFDRRTVISRFHGVYGHRRTARVGRAGS